VAGEDDPIDGAGRRGADQRPEVVGVLDLIEDEKNPRLAPEKLIDLAIAERVRQGGNPLVRRGRRQAAKLRRVRLPHRDPCVRRPRGNLRQAGGRRTKKAHLPHRARTRLKPPSNGVDSIEPAAILASSVPPGHVYIPGVIH
jgi:hypothetical protein